MVNIGDDEVETVEGKNDGTHNSDAGIPETTADEDEHRDVLGEPGKLVEQSDRANGAKPDSGDTSNEGRHASPIGDDDGVAEREVIREVTKEVTQQTLEMLVSSGPVPSPGELYQYSGEHQERIIRMAEAPRTDESLRRTTLVDAQTQVIKRAQWIQAVVFISCIGATAVSLWVFHEPLGAIFLGPPVIQGVNSIVQSVTGKD